MLQENNNCVIDTEMRDIMGKSVYIAEKPSVAQEFAKALHVNFTRKDGYLEGGDHIVTMNVLILIHYIIYNFFFKVEVTNCIIKVVCYCGKERFRLL